MNTSLNQFVNNTNSNTIPSLNTFTSSFNFNSRTSISTQTYSNRFAFSSGSNSMNNIGSRPRTVYSAQNPISSNLHTRPQFSFNPNANNRTYARVASQAPPILTQTMRSKSTGSQGDQLIDALENLSLNTTQVHKPPNFRYDTDPKIWLKKYEKSALLNGWRDIHKVKNFAKFVSEDVLNWITESFQSLENIDWTDFKNAFLNEFQMKDRGITNRMKLNTLKQESNENVRAYLRRGLDLIESVNNRMRDREKIEILTFGLKYELRDKVLNLGVWPVPGGISQFRQMVINAENFLEMNKVIDNSHNLYQPQKRDNKINHYQNRMNNSRVPEFFDNRKTQKFENRLNRVGIRNQIKDNNQPRNSIENRNEIQNINYNKKENRNFGQSNKISYSDKKQNRNNYFSETQRSEPHQWQNRESDRSKYRFQCFGCGSIEHKVSDCPVRIRERMIVNRFENNRDNDRKFNYSKVYSNDYQRDNSFKQENRIYVPTQRRASVQNKFISDQQSISFEAEDESQADNKSKNQTKPKFKVFKSVQTEASPQTGYSHGHTQTQTDLNEIPRI